MDEIGQSIRRVDTDADLTRADHSIGAPIGERRATKKRERLRQGGDAFGG